MSSSAPLAQATGSHPAVGLATDALTATALDRLQVDQLVLVLLKQVDDVWRFLQGLVVCDLSSLVGVKDPQLHLSDRASRRTAVQSPG